MIIGFKVHVLGPGVVYRSLSWDESRWEVVLAGVRSGRAEWLHVASALYPSLDTHPGEEMLGAVGSVFEANSAGALQVLLPRYGAEVVCSTDSEGAPLPVERATGRLRALRELSVAEVSKERVESCSNAIEKVIQRQREPSNIRYSRPRQFKEEAR